MAISPAPQANPPLDGARLDFRGAMSYGDYLQLDAILAAASSGSAQRYAL